MVERKVEDPLVPLGLLKSKHRLAILSSGFFLSVGNQAFVSRSYGGVNMLMIDVPHVSAPELPKYNWRELKTDG